MSSHERLCLWIGKKDRERLEMIRLSYGTTLSAAMRMIIRASYQRLGIAGGETTEDLLKNK